MVRMSEIIKATDRRTEQVRIRRDQYERIAIMAERNGRTLISQMTILLSIALEANGGEE